MPDNTRDGDLLRLSLELAETTIQQLEQRGGAPKTVADLRRQLYRLRAAV